MDLNEFQTRRQKIDVALKEQGWNVRNSSKVLTEIDTKQSDFRRSDYKRVSETLRNNLESKYVDYLLLDSKREPLAIIEAKRTSKDPKSGQRQAEEYAADIKKQTGKDVFIFLSNGYEIIFWNKSYETLRPVRAFHSRDDLETIRFHNQAKKPFATVPIRKEIVNRPYQIEAVKRVTEGVHKCRRKFLIVQATGSGKTRVAMAIIDIMLRANRAKRVLFLTDRKTLRTQAHDEGFMVWFPNEARKELIGGRVVTDARLYAATIQTMMECYLQYSPGFFDIIISDEAHRSIYNKWKDVFTYFDAIQIGLTATPSDMIERDTFRFFQCEENTPTVLYTYEQAVEDGYLADFQVYEAQTHFQIEGIKPDEIPDQVKKELLEAGLEEDQMSWEGTEIEKKVAVIGTNEAIVREFMDNCLTDRTGTLPAKSIFFAVSKKHARRLSDAFEKLYPEYRGRLVRIITSDDSYAQELIKEFKLNPFPRIAISVDMLDTGVDIPEVCNLAFVKPVFSKIKFWQMIGRGTRHDDTCAHKDWLPFGKKEHFLIFDFWKNFEYFKMKPEGKIAKPTEAVTTRIFRLRLRQLAIFINRGDEEKTALLKSRVLNDINALPMDSVSVRNHMRDIEKAKSEKLWDNIAIDPIEFLDQKMTPLMRYLTDVNINTASFVLRCEQLALAVLGNKIPAIDDLKKQIGEDLNCLPRTLNQVSEKEELLDKVLSRSFWQNIGFDDVLTLIEEFGPLMPYKRIDPNPLVVLDMDDIIQQRRMIEYGTSEQPKQEYVKTYKKKVEQQIKELAERDPTLRRIRENKPLTENDLIRLERSLNSPELYITEEVLQKVYGHTKGTLVEFIKSILGLYEFPDPQKVIEEEFRTFMVEHNQLFSADQINFLRTLQTVFAGKKHIDYRDFFEAPFTNFGTNAPVPLFSKEQLHDIVSMCNRLEQQLYAEAV